jgi:hypothetical protein
MLVFSPQVNLFDGQEDKDRIPLAVVGRGPERHRLP